MTRRRHTVQLYGPFGQFMGELAFARLSYMLAERQAGPLELTLPSDQRLPLSLFAKDSVLLITRDVGAGPALVAPWLVRRRRLARDSSGQLRLTIAARHINDLLARRIVVAAAGSAAADKTAFADDLIKAVVREQLVAPTDAARAMAALSVQADLGAAPSVSKAFAYQNVLSVLQNVCQMSAEAGTYLGFEVQSVAFGSYQLVTYVGQRGVDRRITSGRYLPIGPDAGIGAYAVEDDWTAEATAIYAGGQGQAELRDLASAANATASAASPVGRAERFRQATMVAFGNTAGLTDEAEAALYADQARVRFDGLAQDAPGAIYGRDYGWGDLLTVTAEGRTFDCRVDPVRVIEDDQGETRDIRLTSERVL